VRVSWSGTAPLYRVFRRAPGQPGFSMSAEVPGPEWVDTATQYGRSYAYQVTGVARTPTGEAVSDPSFAVQIVPRDLFPPDPPAKLRAVVSASTIELAWEPSGGATDYVVYRAAAGEQWRQAGSTAGAPAFSDKPPRPGVVYRYTVTARDAAGNESAKSEAAEASLP
jgi:fibronectin type 3 domain-containing protein